jgi:hypothetical protein
VGGGFFPASGFAAHVPQPRSQALGIFALMDVVVGPELLSSREEGIVADYGQDVAAVSAEVKGWAL